MISKKEREENEKIEQIEKEIADNLITVISNRIFDIEDNFLNNKRRSKIVFDKETLEHFLNKICGQVFYDQGEYQKSFLAQLKHRSIDELELIKKVVETFAGLI